MKDTTTTDAEREEALAALLGIAPASEPNPRRRAARIAEWLADEVRRAGLVERGDAAVLVIPKGDGVRIDVNGMRFVEDGETGFLYAAPAIIEALRAACVLEEEKERKAAARAAAMRERAERRAALHRRAAELSVQLDRRVEPPSHLTEPLQFRVRMTEQDISEYAAWLKSRR